MSSTLGFRFKALAMLLVIAMFANACGGDDSSDFEAQAVSQAATADVDLSLVVTELASGFGSLGRAQRQTIARLANNGATCTDAATERARPLPSQVEVEIVSVVDECLRFSYDVANFGSLVADLRALRQGAQVLAVSPLLIEYRLDHSAQPSDPAWPIDAIDGSAFFAEPNAPTGADVVIGVIDSGIDTSHPSVANIAIDRLPDSGQGDYTATGHGTIAASIIVGPIDQASRGIAPGVTLLDVPADLCEPSVCGCDPCALITPAEAIRWATDKGAHILSMSFGFLPAPKPAWWQLLLDDREVDSALDTIEIALAYARASDVAMVAAAGNCATGPSERCESEDQFEVPAGHPGVIGVAAITAGESGDPARAWYSTRQDYVELAAPGTVSILNTAGEQTEKSGTSYAAPFVSAALAILIGADGPLANQPDATSLARGLLTETAYDLEPEGRDSASGYGQLQLATAVRAGTDYAESHPLTAGAETPAG